MIEINSLTGLAMMAGQNFTESKYHTPRNCYSNKSRATLSAKQSSPSDKIYRINSFLGLYLKISGETYVTLSLAIKTELGRRFPQY
jgi:hypothetical protein